MFTYGDIVYSLYEDLTLTIIDRSDYKFVNNNPDHFTTDKDYALRFRALMEHEEEK